jgi:hypothetical protein
VCDGVCLGILECLLSGPAGPDLLVLCGNIAEFGSGQPRFGPRCQHLVSYCIFL